MLPIGRHKEKDSTDTVPTPSDHYRLHERHQSGFRKPHEKKNPQIDFVSIHPSKFVNAQLGEDSSPTAMRQ